MRYPTAARKGTPRPTEQPMTIDLSLLDSECDVVALANGTGTVAVADDVEVEDVTGVEMTVVV